MPSEGPNFPNTEINATRAGSDSVWNNPGDASSSNNVRAVTAFLMDDGELTDYLKATDLGFSIDGSATIDGVVVEVEGRNPQAGGVLYEELFLVKDGTIRTDGTNGAAKEGFPSMPGADEFTSFNDSTSLWNLTWTPAQINATGFGVAVVCQGDNSTDSEDCEIDSLRITVHYSDGTGGGGGGSSNHNTIEYDKASSLKVSSERRMFKVLEKAATNNPQSFDRINSIERV